MIWGGNTPGLLLGQRVNFWGSQWEQQVAAGDYHARGSFKGYGTATGSPITLCEPTATTTGTPRLDAACWTSKPGNSNPPAALGDFIQVIVTTSVNKSGSTIYGNIASTVVVQVDRTSPYAPDPGHPGYGTIVAVIGDGGGLFPRTTTTAAPSEPVTQDLSSPIGRAVAAGTHRYSLYSPELHLIAETELTTVARPAITNEYIWFNGHPIAQVDSTGVTNWTFTDHLGTPILQTSSTQGVTWRAEYEPFGEVYALRSYDRHQPLRLPGQEAEQLGTGANGVTERSYNIHRWYRGGWGRYSQVDPVDSFSMHALYSYTNAHPLTLVDPNGLRPTRLTDSQCCVLAASKGLFEMGGIATLICCEGRRVPCMMRQLTTDYPSVIALQIRKRCILEHEVSHIPDVICKTTCFIDHAPFPDADTRTRSECNAYRKESQCLGKNRSQCGSDTNCLKAIDEAIEYADLLWSFFGGEPQCGSAQ